MSTSRSQFSVYDIITLVEKEIFEFVKPFLFKVGILPNRNIAPLIYCAILFWKMCCRWSPFGFFYRCELDKLLQQIINCVDRDIKHISCKNQQLKYIMRRYLISSSSSLPSTPSSKAMSNSISSSSLFKSIHYFHHYHVLKCLGLQASVQDRRNQEDRHSDSHLLALISHFSF